MADARDTLPAVDRLYDRAAEVRELDAAGLLDLADHAIRVATVILATRGEARTASVAESALHPLAEALAALRMRRRRTVATETEAEAPRP